ncbi:arginine deiminase [Candidatus Ornithobacterium hominis]|uniref:dimethylarginine dimethylaminohydrolase family protein n=1 Tax=Candidatus Ornithobacterium hominis TaxID=2497989 RepID=UPI000E5A6F98|nr:arginine deiminase family protein [Candidatus Ornithobacterium hominis]SZD73582.1 arginine deiminase [Candidatus Ornithobacterium hominis]
MILNIKNETSRLKAVVLGNPYSMGQKPELKETFDAKSFYSVLNDDYPTQQAVIEEMKIFENVLKKHAVQVFRPYEIENYNQIYARDIAFVIDEKLIIANLIEDRKKELEAFEQIFNSVSENKIIRVAEDEHIEGGDVILWNEFMFVGTYKKPDYPHYKTARTNAKAIQMLKTKFPDKWVIDMELHKNDNDPYAGVLHLDCCFQPVGKDKAIIYKDAFINPRNYETLIDLFGRKNIFEITKDEFFYMAPNIFSIAPDVVVSEENFTRLNRHMRDEWGIQVEEIPYQNISKMGGLLRCSTMPLIRE